MHLDNASMAAIAVVAVGAVTMTAQALEDAGIRRPWPGYYCAAAGMLLVLGVAALSEIADIRRWPYIERHEVGGLGIVIVGMALVCLLTAYNIRATSHSAVTVIPARCSVRSRSRRER